MTLAINNTRYDAASATVSRKPEPTDKQKRYALQDWTDVLVGRGEDRKAALVKIEACFRDRHIRTLRLSGLGLTVAPPYFPRNVKEIDLSGNRLTRVFYACAQVLGKKLIWRNQSLRYCRSG